MSDLALYQVPHGTDVAANLPPVNLPGSSDGQERPTVTIYPKPKTPPPTDKDWEAAGFAEKPPKAATTAPTSGEDPWKAAGFSETPPEPHRKIGVGEAAGRGAIDAITFGAAPAAMGAAAAGAQGEQMPPSMGGEFPGMETLATGAERLTRGVPAAQIASDEASSEFLNQQNAAQKQHPIMYGAGELGGAMLTPGFGAGTAGTWPARLATGAVAGGVGGALYGAGSAVGEGGGAPEVIKSAAKGAILGTLTGGVLKGAIGPRVAKAVETPAENAARKGVEINAELPRGFTGGPFQAATTAALQSSPFSGQLITNRVKKFGEKFGEHIADTAGEMGGGAGRSGADAVARHGLQDVVDNNKDAIDKAYSAVRARFDPNQRYTMPRTEAALNEIMKARSAAGWTNPAEGLEQFRNVAGGATFSGAHRARVDARDAGNALVPHPGYNKGDYNRLTRAMTSDLRDMAAHAGGGKALAEFEKAEKQFGQLAQQNDALNKLINAKGEGAISTLLNSAKEKSGNLSLLAQLRRSMSPEDFEMIGGTLLNELGKAGPAGEFSPARFATDWGKLSEGAKRTLFSPSHVKDIDELVGAAKHLTKALERSNRSHTTGALLVFDTLKTIAEFGIAVGAGVVDPTAGLVTGGGVAASHILTIWLASPSKAASMRAWGNAYRDIFSNPSAARIAAFKIATRNLSNNIGVPADKIMSAVQSKADEQTGPDKK